MVLATTYAVLKFTLPAFEPVLGNCTGQGPVPERRIAYCWLDYRPEGDSTWVRTWRVGVRGDSLMNGKEIMIGIPKDGATWFRIVPVDSAGNEACWAKEILMP